MKMLFSLEFPQFDPDVSDDDTWDAGEDINTFLQKNYNQTIIPSSRDKIMNDFSKPTCQALQVPNLDKDMKKQIKKVGKDPRYGAERSLFMLQGHLLDIAGPLTCL